MLAVQPPWCISFRVRNITIAIIMINNIIHLDGVRNNFLRVRGQILYTRVLLSTCVAQTWTILCYNNLISCLYVLYVYTSLLKHSWFTVAINQTGMVWAKKLFTALTRQAYDVLLHMDYNEKTDIIIYNRIGNKCILLSRGSAMVFIQMRDKTDSHSMMRRHISVLADGPLFAHSGTIFSLVFRKYIPVFDFGSDSRTVDAISTRNRRAFNYSVGLPINYNHLYMRFFIPVMCM